MSTEAHPFLQLRVVQSFRSRHPSVRCVAFGLLVCIGCCAGCSIRYDAAGMTRVGIGLWGFGDPPGVQWHLEAPRQEIPSLPAAPRPELPPRTIEPWSRHDASCSRADDDARVRPAMPLKDNHHRASRRPIDSACLLARSTFARRPDRARG
jgi:hypothetical protein